MFDFSDSKAPDVRIPDNQWGNVPQLSWNDAMITAIAWPQGMHSETFLILLLHMLHAVRCDYPQRSQANLIYNTAISSVTHHDKRYIRLCNMELARALTLWFSDKGSLSPTILPKFLSFVFNPPSNVGTGMLHFGEKTLKCAHPDLLAFSKMLVREREENKDSAGVKKLDKLITSMEAIAEPHSQLGVTHCIALVRDTIKTYALRCSLKPTPEIKRCIDRIATRQGALAA